MAPALLLISIGCGQDLALSGNEPRVDIAALPRDGGSDAQSPPDYAVTPDKGVELDGGGGDLRDGATTDFAVCRVQDRPSVTQVTLRIHNGTKSDRLVSTAETKPGPGGGNTGWCTGYSIDAQGNQLPIRAGFQVACEGPNPGPVYSTGWHRVRPGESFDLKPWDGRALLACTYYTPCDPPWNGAPPAALLYFGSQPAPAGLYRATVAVEAQVPGGCQSQNGVDYGCLEQPMGPPLGIDLAIERRCPSTSIAGADFTLPKAGPATVTIELM